MNILEVENLNYSYGPKLVLKDISFSIARGSFISIIGPNGSGKSTLLKTINNTYKRSSGNIFLNEKPIEEYKVKDLAKEIAMVPQYTNIDYDFDVIDIVLMGRYPHKDRFSKYNEMDYKNVRKAMEITNTYKFKDRKITQLSGGEIQRVIIAKAIAQDSNILLLDEPTSNLDINHQIEIMEFLKKLNQEGKTIVMVLHDINLAARYTKEIILINEGEVLDRGKPEKVISKQNLEQAYSLVSEVDINKYTNTIDITPISVLDTSY